MMISLGKAKQGRSARIALCACWILYVGCCVANQKLRTTVSRAIEFFFLKIACDREESFLIETGMAMVMQFEWTFLFELEKCDFQLPYLCTDA